MYLENILGQDSSSRLSGLSGVNLSYFSNQGSFLLASWSYLPVASALLMVGRSLQGKMRVTLFWEVEIPSAPQHHLPLFPSQKPYL